MSQQDHEVISVGDYIDYLRKFGRKTLIEMPPKFKIVKVQPLQLEHKTIYETDVIYLRTLGLSQSEIAEKLGTTRQTIEYIWRRYDKYKAEFNLNQYYQKDKL